MFETVVDLMEESFFSDTVAILAISKLTVKKTPERGAEMNPACLFKAGLFCPRFKC